MGWKRERGAFLGLVEGSEFLIGAVAHMSVNIACIGTIWMNWRLIVAEGSIRSKQTVPGHSCLQDKYPSALVP